MTSPAEGASKLQKIAARVPGVVYQYQQWPDGRTAFPYASEGIMDIYGVTPAEVVDDATPVFDVLHPDDLDRVAESIRRSMETQTTWHCVYRVTIPGRPVSWVEGESTPEAMPDGSTLWHGYIRDITARRRAEHELYRREEQLELIGDNIPNSFVFEFARHPDGTYRFLFASKGIEEMHGLTLDEVLDDPSALARQIDPEHREAYATGIEESWRNLTDFVMDWRFLHPRDGWRWKHVGARPKRKPNGSTVWYGVSTDITAQKRAARDLRIKEAAMAAANAGIALADADWRLTYVNPAWLKLFGAEEADALIGTSVLPLIDGSGVASQVVDTVADRHAWTGELVCQRPDGSVFHAALAVDAITDPESGAPIRMLSVQDISARIAIAQQRATQRQQLTTITQSARDAIIMMNTRGQVEFWNPAAETLFGYRDVEVLGADLHKLLVPARFRAAFDDAFPTFSHSGEGSAIGTTTELMALHKSGSEIPVEVSLSAVPMHDGWHAVGIVRDISERRRSEQALADAFEQIRRAVRDRDALLANLDREAFPPAPPQDADAPADD